MLVKIENTDISQNIIAGSYDVNEYEVSKVWTDGNGRKHKDFIRKKIQGSFTLKYNTQEEYKKFLLRCRNSKEDGLLPLTVHVNNTGEEKEIMAFCDFYPVMRKNRAEKLYDSFEFELEEQ